MKYTRPRKRIKQTFYDKHIKAKNIYVYELSTNTCKYPTAIDSKDVTLFCGCNTNNSSYCSDHEKICFLPKKSMTRDRKTEKRQTPHFQ